METTPSSKKNVAVIRTQARKNSHRASLRPRETQFPLSLKHIKSHQISKSPESFTCNNRCKSQLTVADKKPTKGSYDGSFFKIWQSCRDKRNLARNKAGWAAGTLLATELNSPTANCELAKTELECSVCASTFLPEYFPSLSACKHEPDVCQPYFTNWLVQGMNGTGWENIKCPASDCKNRISYEDVRENAPEDVFTRYCLCCLSLAC